jgi:N utilization substance protein A
MNATSKTDFMTVLEQMERDKGIPKEEIIKILEQAHMSACRKHVGQLVNVAAKLDPATGQTNVFVVKTLVETVTNPTLEITPDEARKIKNGELTDTELRVPIDAGEFARMAAQIAHQLITQKVRETERESFYVEFKPKEGTLLNGAVSRFVARNIMVDVGRATEGILPVREQVRRERWLIGDRIRVLIQKVEKGVRGPEVVLSRAHPDFVKRLFEQEVPEIYEKTVEVLEVVREPGLRSKVVVRSNNPKVDAIGACVGVKGSRVRPIINELQGERIDLVAHSPEAAAFIGNALSPAKPMAVKILSHEEKRAEVVVSDDQLALAIGKGGQNVRLAAKLTGWSIDVRSEAQKRESSALSDRFMAELALQEGVGHDAAQTLKNAGWGDVNRLAGAPVADVAARGVDESVAERIVAAAQEFLRKKAEAAAQTLQFSQSQPPAEETPAVEIPVPAETEPAPPAEPVDASAASPEPPL